MIIILNTIYTNHQLYIILYCICDYIAFKMMQDFISV